MYIFKKNINIRHFVIIENQRTHVSGLLVEDQRVRFGTRGLEINFWASEIELSASNHSPLLLTFSKGAMQ